MQTTEACDDLGVMHRVVLKKLVTVLRDSRALLMLHPAGKCASCCVFRCKEPQTIRTRCRGLAREGALLSDEVESIMVAFRVSDAGYITASLTDAVLKVPDAAPHGPFSAYSRLSRTGPEHQQLPFLGPHLIVARRSIPI